jgi:hypothetical protein
MTALVDGDSAGPRDEISEVIVRRGTLIPRGFSTVCRPFHFPDTGSGGSFETLR